MEGWNEKSRQKWKRGYKGGWWEKSSRCQAVGIDIRRAGTARITRCQRTRQAKE